MSWLSDSTELVSGGWLSSAYPGHGILGSNVPSSGSDGVPLLFDDLSLPAENADEFRLVLTQYPTGFTSLVFNEDSSLQITGPAGTYTGTVLGYKNGEEFGYSGFSITLGSSTSSILRDMNQAFSGKRLLTTNLVGVRGDTIPSTGTDGPPYAYNDLELPADNERLIRGFITTFPTSGTLIAEDDTSFTFEGAPAGTYTFQYDLIVDDVNLGSANANLVVVDQVFAGLNVVLDSTAPSISANQQISGVISVTLDPVSTGISAIVPITTFIQTSTEGTTFTGSVSVSPLTSISTSLAEVGTGLSLESGNFGSFSITLDNIEGVVASNSGIGSSFSVRTDDALFIGFAFSIVTSDSSLNVITADTVVEGSFISLPSPIANISVSLDAAEFSGSAVASATSNTGFNVTLSPVTTSVSASSIFTGSSLNVTTADAVFTGSAIVTLPTNTGAINITLEDMPVYMTAIGSNPPRSKGPNVRVPIALSVNLDGKLVIL